MQFLYRLSLRHAVWVLVLGVTALSLLLGFAVTALIEHGTWSRVALVTLLLLVAGLVAEKLQRLISEPVRQLTGTARQVAQAGDYSLRDTPPLGIREIVALYDAWNLMLGRIEQRARAKEGELRREQELLQRTNRQLERYTRALESSNEQLKQFAYVASHDLQEPLRTVSSYVQLLARRYAGRLDADADDFIAFAVDGAQRMQALIEDLLSFARINQQHRLEPTSCEEVLEVVKRNLQATLASNQAVIEHQPLPTLQADPSQLVQLFQNLINNAVKFRREAPPRIQIAARPDGHHWIFSIRDNGLGIEPEYLQRIFVIFQRLHNRERYPGTGIGLAICKRIVENHHGRIWVDSTPGDGSTFFFSLATAEEEVHEVAAVTDSGPMGGFAG